MKDKRFLCWIHERLVRNGDSKHVDFLHKLRAIIRDTDPNKDSRSDTSSDFDVVQMFQELKD
jgi:hypothetical protein